MNKDKKEYIEINNFLKDLESIPEPVEEYSILKRIQKFATERFGQNVPDILTWEQMAFAFTENYTDNNSGWGTYFGPMFVLSDKKGKTVEYPSIRKITPEVISYWEKRTKESINPVFKARYSSLVWDFSEKITGKKPHYSIAQIYIDSVVEIAEKGVHKYSANVIKKIERALSLALSISDKKRINRLIETTISYERKIGEDDKPGLWGFSYEFLIKNKKVPISTDKKREIIAGLEKRFDRLLRGDDHWAAQRAALLLVDYYSKIEKKEKVKETLLKYGELVQRQAEKVSSLVADVWLERLYHLYIQYGIKDEAERILNKIREKGKKAKDEFKEIKIPVEIPKDELEKYINWLTDGDLKTVLQKIAVNYIPRKDEAIKQLQDLSKESPILFLLTRKIMTTEGQPVATVGSLEEDINSHIILQISQNMQISSIFLRETLNALMDKFKLTTEKIIRYFYESSIFDEKKKEILIKGVEAYLKGDYVVSLHMLIPQVEAIIRNLSERLNIPIMKPSRSGGFFYRTLDDLLRENRINEVLGEDMCLYFRILLTDPRGWNLRNEVCHGISNPEQFNQTSADRIFHVLLCLASLVR